MLARRLRAVGGGSAALEFSLEHTASADSIGANSTTFLSCALGTADASREIWVTVSIDFDGSNGYSPTCTVGGVSATQVLEWPTQNNGKGVAIFRASVASGTTGDVVVGSGGAGDLLTVSIAVYRLVNYSTTAADTFTSSTYTDDISLTAAANDSAVLAVIVSAANNSNPTYSGLTLDYDPDTNVNNTWTHYSATGQSTGTNTYNCTAGGSGTFHCAAVVISPA